VSDKKGRIIVVTSGKGGVGKSSVTGNLGAALAFSGKSVIIADMDMGLRNMDIILNAEKEIVFNIVDVVQNVCRVDQALVTSALTPNLRLLPASQLKDKDYLRDGDVYAVMELLGEMADYVLIDCPAGIESGFRYSVGGADEVLLVVNPEISSLRDSDRVIELIQDMGKDMPVSLVINRFREDLSESGIQLPVRDVTEILPANLVGVIPETDGICRDLRKGTFSLSSGGVSGLFMDMARRFDGEDVPMRLSCEEKAGGGAFIAAVRSLKKIFSAAAC
jgi:septum site-determining protein MinD